MGPKVITHKYVDPKNKKVRLKHYHRRDLLGKGGFAHCFLIKSVETKKNYACKIIPKSKLIKKSTRLKLVTEIKIHRMVSNHKNIVRFIKWFEDEKHVYIVLEHCKNQSLLELVNGRGKLTESEVRYFMSQILSSLRHLHGKNVIHRDLKLGNIFVSENFVLKLGDFGLATKLEWKAQRKMTLCGTPNYIAPEMLTRSEKGHSFEVDIWSLGVIMYTMLVGVPPFETAEVRSTYSRIRKNKFDFPENSFVSEASQTLIRKILRVEPAKRPTLKEIRLDPFFTEALIPRALPPATKTSIPVISEFKESVSESVIDARPSSEALLESAKSDKGHFSKVECKHIKEDFGGKGDKKSWHERFPFASKETIREVERLGERYGLEAVLKGAEKPEEKAMAKGIGLAERSANKKDLGGEKPSVEKEGGCNIETFERDASAFQPLVWMSSWIDYSSKFGIGYVLSTGIHGVYFNDCSKMLLHRDKEKIEYFELADSEEKNTSFVSETRTTLDTFRYDIRLKKKVTLLKYFSEYLQRKQNKELIVQNGDDVPLDQQSDPVRVSHWYKTTKAKAFVFSNGVFQVNFNDNSEVIVSPLCQCPLRRSSTGRLMRCENAQTTLIPTIEFFERSGALTFTDRKGERSSLKFETALNSSQRGIRQRTRYCREVLRKVLDGLPSITSLTRQ